MRSECSVFAEYALYFIIDVSFCSTLSWFYDTWITKHYRMIWYITIYICVRCYQYIVSNMYSPYYCCINSDPYFIPYYWGSLSSPSIFLSYRHTFVNIAIFSYYNFWVYCNTIWMA